MEVGGHYAFGLEMLLHRIHHGWRAAEVDIDIAAMQRLGGQVVGDIALALMRGVRIGHAGAEAKARDLQCIGLQALDQHQVRIAGDAIDHMDGLGCAVAGQHLQHRQEGRQARAARQKQQRPRDCAQVKAAQRPGHLQRVARAGALEPAAHQAAGHLLDQKAHAALARRGAERVGAVLAAARHADIDVLPGQKCGCGLCHIQHQFIGGIAKGLHRAHRGAELAGAGLAGGRRHRHGDHAVGLWHHLAGQHQALAGFVFGQRVVDVVVAQVVSAALGLALAGAADAVRAVHRQVDTVAEGGVQHFFVGAAVHKAGDPVFKVQGNAIAVHGGLLACQMW